MYLAFNVAKTMEVELTEEGMGLIIKPYVQDLDLGVLCQ
jgi:virulence-associated protein VagC